MKHTQSEWLYSKYSGGDYGVYPIEGNGNDIALVRDRGGEAEANAKLIAAAPELLEALQLINDSGCMLSDYLTDKMLNAIQKATN